jgi:hypothetical protein
MTPQEKVTCRITIVEPGKSDSVIKVFPAYHKEEKIWIDNNNGRERLEAIRDFCKKYGPSFGVLPEPLYYHPGNTRDTNTNFEKEIPIITLAAEDMVLPAPPIINTKLPDIKSPMEERIDRLERVLSKTLEALDVKTEEKNETVEQFVCEKCSKEFKTKALLAMHMAKMHKE